MTIPDGAPRERRPCFSARGNAVGMIAVTVQFGVRHALFHPSTRSRQGIAARTIRLWALVCLVLSWEFAGCSFQGSTPLSKAENTLRVPWYGAGTNFDPGILDPARASPSTPLFLASLTSAGLVKFSPDLHVIPELAVSIPTISTDSRSYTFTIRQDARYADGRQCTAADVAYSLARALSPAEHAPLAAQYLGGIKGAMAVESGRAGTLSGVRVLHRLTVRIRLTAPDATFLDKLAFPVAAIMSRGGSGGLGPFVQVHSPIPSTLVFTPRENYFGGPVQVDSIHVVAVRDAATGLQMYRKGLLDAAWVAPAQMPAISRDAEFSGSKSLDGYYAITSASDGSEGAELAARLDRSRLLPPSAPALSALESIVPPTVPDYVSSAPSLAGSSAAAAPSPAPVRLRVAQPTNGLSQLLRAALRQQWNTSPVSRHDVWIVHATFLLPDPGRWLNIVSNGAPSWYRSDLDRANSLTNDPVSRMSSYSDVEAWALSKGLIIPLATGTLGYLTKPAVQGLDVTASGLMPDNNNWTSVSIT
jgi:hypothetical protein